MDAPNLASTSRTQKQKAWVDPASLPNYGDVASISGNVPDYVKQLNLNTYHSYGVGDEDCFGHQVGKAVKFVEVSVNRSDERQGRMEATTVAEVTVSKRELYLTPSGVAAAAPPFYSGSYIRVEPTCSDLRLC
jgi:acyl-coenzyme A thioesterase 13